jgi:TfoX/Sxy family transcriptional regulator of competence genes
MPEMPKMPKPSEAAKAAFAKLVPSGPGVTSRPMFGQPAAFVSGNMFTCLFGDDLVVRLGAEGASKLIKQGGKQLEPMPGRPMTGYATVPGAWQKSPAAASKLVIEALDFTRTNVKPKAAKAPAKRK